MNQNPKNHVTLSHFTSISLQTAAIYIYALPNRTYFQNPFQMWPRRIIDKKGPSIEQSRGHTEQWIRISSQRAEKGSNQPLSSIFPHFCRHPSGFLSLNLQAATTDPCGPLRRGRSWDWSRLQR